MKIILFGSIGAGKSAVCARLQDIMPAATMLQEPIDELRAELDSLYKKCPGAALAFQRHMVEARIRHARAANLLIMDGHVRTDYEIYSQVHLQTGKMSDDELEQYRQLIIDVHDAHPTNPAVQLDSDTLFVHLTADPAVCQSRIKHRNSASGERELDRAFFELMARVCEGYALELSTSLDHYADVLRIDTTDTSALNAAMKIHSHLSRYL